MDISETIAPTSDQLDAVDLLGGPRTFTITEVTKGSSEQPVNVHLAEFPRPWRPGKSMRRVLVAAWGADASVYVGRSLTLFCDPKVRFGGQEVGGVRVAAMSHIDKPQSVPLIVSRGKSAVFKVQVLKDAPTQTPAQTHTLPTADQIAAETDLKKLREWWQAAGEGSDLRQAIEQRVGDVQAANADQDAGGEGAS